MHWGTTPHHTDLHVTQPMSQLALERRKSILRFMQFPPAQVVTPLWHDPCYHRYQQFVAFHTHVVGCGMVWCVPFLTGGVRLDVGSGGGGGAW